MGGKNYPKAIIPKQYYKGTIVFEEIESTKNNYVVIRRSLKDSANTFDSLGYLRQDSLVDHEKDIFGLSMNLLSDKYRAEYVKFRTKDAANSRWNEGERVKINDYLNFIEILSNPYPIFSKLNEIANKNIPITKNLNKQERNKILGKLKISNEEIKNYKFKGSTTITHSPIRLNYWHVEFNIFKDKNIYDNELIRYSKSKWQKDIAKYALRDLLIVHALPHLPQSYTRKIPPRLYKMNLIEFIFSVLTKIIKREIDFSSIA
ncbi:hypothetical protein BMS3Abin03_01523 [bacterium BMS3Abin03]|nr:hypothetical protein BMS3Abin03_01523 [bacterium BMS3Abin03]